MFNSIFCSFQKDDCDYEKLCMQTFIWEISSNEFTKILKRVTSILYSAYICNSNEFNFSKGSSFKFLLENERKKEGRSFMSSVLVMVNDDSVFSLYQFILLQFHCPTVHISGFPHTSSQQFKHQNYIISSLFMNIKIFHAKNEENSSKKAKHFQLSLFS